MNSIASMSTALARVRGSRVGRYAVPAAVVLVALGGRAALTPAIPASSMWSIAGALGVAVAAWFGGWGPVAFATLLTLTVLELIHGGSAVVQSRASGGLGSLEAVGLVGQTAIVSLCVAGLVRGRDDRRLRRVHDDVVAQLGQRLVERGAEIRAILDTSPTGIAIAADPECDRISMNGAAASILERIASTPATDPSMPLPEPIDRGIAPLRELMRRAVTAARPIGPIELEIVHADGTHQSLLEYASPLLDAQGRVRGCVAALIDTTELGCAKRAVRERDRALGRNFESVSVGKAHISQESGRLERVNRRLCLMLRRSAEELTRCTLADLLEPDEHERIASMLHRVTKRRDRAIAGEYRLLRSDGVTVFGAISIAEECDGVTHPARLVVAIEDITARSLAERELGRYRRQLEEQVAARTASLEESHARLRLSERMASLGTLCAGLGHDMGNLLLPVRLRLEAMELKGVPTAIAEDMRAIGTCAEYLQRLANGLRLLSLDPDHSGGSGTTNLVEWWADVESFLKNCLPRGVELERLFDENLPLARIPRHRLTQAIFNLVQNAGDAIGCEKPGGGRVRIAARVASGDGAVQIVVSDDGCGMSPEVRAHCLEPFFTRKPRGISTGLGLSLVHGIVRQAGGSIDVDSTEGVGTSFTITLPTAPALAPAPDMVPSRPPIRVLVTVDDVRLRSYAVAVGKAMGCVVDDEALSSGAPVGAPSDASDRQDRVWVTSVAHLEATDIERYLCGAGQSARRVIAFGESPDGMTSPVGVQWISNPTPSRIRAAFRACLAGLTDASAGASPGSDD
jgi:PAS domain S-box-containing protein